MKYLFLDTASSHRVLALIDNNKIVYYLDENNGTDLSIKMVKIIEDAFKCVDFTINDIDKIFIGTGPGSFTGTRIGITIAKVLAWSLKIDIIPVSTLEMFASTNNISEYSVPYIDARRDYFYTGIYDNNLNAVVTDTYISKSNLEVILKKYNDKTFISYTSEFEDTMIPKPNILNIIKKHINDTPVNPHSIIPNYIKKTEAEEKLENK